MASAEAFTGTHAVEMHTDATAPIHSKLQEVKQEVKLNFHLILPHFEARKASWEKRKGGM